MMTSFYLAIATNKLDEFKKFIKNAKDVETHPYVIKYVAEFGNIEMIEYLVNLGADIHCDQDAPVRVAIYRKKFELAEYLIRLGANIGGRNNNILIVACKMGDLDIVKFFVKHGVNSHTLNEAIRHASLFSRYDIVKFLLLNGAYHINICVPQYTLIDLYYCCKFAMVYKLCINKNYYALNKNQFNKIIKSVTKIINNLLINSLLIHKNYIDTIITFN